MNLRYFKYLRYSLYYAIRVIVLFITSAKGGYVFGRVGLFVCPSVRRKQDKQDYLQSIEWIRMKHLPGVYFGPRNNPYPLNFIWITI